ncbi:MAG: CHRD domain-containing protein [Acidimicrobiia bacterium]|nr:CHRD domain-containing protein [Acidimicrobiia bacterium]
MSLRRSIKSVLVAMALLASITQPALATGDGAGSMLQTDCANPPSIMAVEDITRGMTGKAYTTLSGRTISEFDVEILGVLPNAVYPLIDLILVEASGPAVEAVGGIAAGFSGSPVYIDGHLIGAIAYGFYGNSFIAGITPAADMVALNSFPASPVPQLTPAGRSALELIESAVGPLGAPQPIPTPVGVSGSADWVEGLQTRAADMGLPITVFPATGSTPGGSTSSSPGVILPGESLSAVLSEGDNAAYGTGTATYCDGSTVVGFGHPMLWIGEVDMAMHEADVVTVLQDSTGFGNFKIVTLGEPAGRIDFDGNAGIRGISGQAAASVPIASSVQFPEYGTSRTGSTDAYMSDSLFFSLGWTSAGHLLTNLDAVSGTGFRPGSSTVSWVVQGLRQDGSAFSASFDNLYWDSFSITDNSIFEMASFIDLLVFNPFEDVTLTSVDVDDARLYTDRRTIDIKAAEVSTTSSPDPAEFSFIQALPGDVVTAEVTLRPYGQTNDVVETVELQIPADFAGGYGSLWIHGGSSEPLYFDPYYQDFLPGGASDFDELLTFVEGRDRNSDLVVELTLFPSFVEEEIPPNGATPQPPDGFQQANGFPDDSDVLHLKEVVSFDAVVRGDRYFDFEVFPEFPPIQGTLTADLAGSNQTGEGDPDGTGTALVIIEGDSLMFDITLEGVDDPVVAAHIHAGAAGENGPVVLDFDVAVNGLSGLVYADPFLLEEILAFPELFYVNVHTETYPDGAVRGQLMYEEVFPDSMLTSVSPAGLWSGGGYEPFYFGVPGDIPFLGDWDGDGIKTPGLYRPSDGYAYLRNSNDTGIADASFYMGQAGDIPIVGDWDGDGTDTFGVYRPRQGKAYLRNSNSTGQTDVEYFFGVPGDVPFAGDFDGDGVTDLGLHRQGSGFVYLRLTHTTGDADVSFYWGVAGDTVLAGDWNVDGVDTVGLIRPSTGMFYYRNTNSTGIADGEWALAGGGWMIAR